MNTSNDKWTLRFGLDTAPLSPSIYTSQAQFELERDQIFRKYWLNLGRVEDIPKPGDYVVHELPLFPTSILLIHGYDGRVRGFHNMCTHRGNKVCPMFAGPEAFVKTGNKRFHTCEFHGWVFNDKGELVDIPDEAEFFDLDRSKMNLREVATDTWEGFIFVNLDPAPQLTLHEQLGDLVNELAGYPFAEYTSIFGYEGELACNWKLSVDSQIEGYHAVTLHRRTLGGPLVGVSDNPMLHMPWRPTSPRRSGPSARAVLAICRLASTRPAATSGSGTFITSFPISGSPLWMGSTKRITSGRWR
jgi:phenylpropionate dioxygenase-like ring-hydroxylating dioxygenase large terminal subunit